MKNYYSIDGESTLSLNDASTYIVRSDKVKVFPCVSRGRSVPVQSEVASTNNGGVEKIYSPAFNYEARANTEFNYTHVIGQTGKRSFVIEWGLEGKEYAGEEATLKFAINGYYFEISGFPRNELLSAVGASDANLPAYAIYAVVSTKSTEISRFEDLAGEEYSELTTTLTSLVENSNGLDRYFDAGDINANPGYLANYFFTGLAFIVHKGSELTIPNRADITLLKLTQGTELAQENLLPAVKSGTGIKAISIGNPNNVAAGENSFAGGVDAVAVGTNSLAFGNVVRAENDAQITLGKYNTINKSGVGEGINATDNDYDDYVLVVGTGSKDKHRDGLVVTSDDIYLQGVHLKQALVSKADLFENVEDEIKSYFELSGHKDNESTTHTSYLTDAEKKLNAAKGVSTYDDYELSHYLKISAQALKLVNYEDAPVTVGTPEPNKTQPVVYFKNGFVKRSTEAIGNNEQPVFLDKGALTVLRQPVLSDKAKDIVPAIEHIATGKHDEIAGYYHFTGTKQFDGETILNNKTKISKDREFLFGDGISFSGNDKTLSVTEGTIINNSAITINKSEIIIPNLQLGTVNSGRTTTFENDVIFTSSRDAKGNLIKHTLTISDTETVKFGDFELKVIEDSAGPGKTLQINPGDKGDIKIAGNLRVTGSTKTDSNSTVPNIKATTQIDTPVLNVWGSWDAKGNFTNQIIKISNNGTEIYEGKLTVAPEAEFKSKTTFNNNTEFTSSVNTFKVATTFTKNVTINSSATVDLREAIVLVPSITIE